MRPGCVQQPRVPFVVAANGPRAMALAARYGEGWGTFGPSLPDEVRDGLTEAQAQDAWWAGLERMVETYDAAAAGTPGLTARRYLSIDGAPIFALRSAAVLVEGVERATALGFTDIVLHWPRAEGVYAGSEAVLDEVAGLLPELRTR